MNDAWTTSPNARRVLQHADDARPVWLWSQDGQRLIWANASAGLFLARVKKSGLKRAAPAAPIKGQVSRIIRLGSPGRTSLARVQMQAGDRPVSVTCATTPLPWLDDETVLLVVGVDPIPAEVTAAAAAEAAGVTESSEITPEAPTARSPAAVEDASSDLPARSGTAEAAMGFEQELSSWQAADAETAYEPAPVERWRAPEPVAAEAEDAAAWLDEPAVEPVAAEAASDREQVDPAETATLADVSRRLSDLVERLAADDALFAPLGEADDQPPTPPVTTTAPAEAENDTADNRAERADEAPGGLFKVIGRGLRPIPTEAEPVVPETQGAPSGSDQPAADAAPPADAAERLTRALAADRAALARDPATVEQVSRYNFDELARILNDRVGDRNTPRRSEPEPPAPSGPETSGALVNLSGETLVLNRLPLGIMVFRDQQILFANRSITQMMGYDTVEALRAAGLAAVFPALGGEETKAGPINHLVQQDGTLVPVTARLQSISWQGRPALMLSASTTEVRTGHEEAVRAFAQMVAELRGDGFVQTTRSGVISTADPVATRLLGGGRPLPGRPLSAVLHPDSVEELKLFIEKPARFAETSRPVQALRSADGSADILLFAAGQAGLLSGYFGLVRRRQQRSLPSGGTVDVDPALLARISRGVRRPLSTIIGFADLLAEGVADADKAGDYARDIGRAGEEIAALVSELDDYARLRDGRYLPQRSRIDLTALLESCIRRIRAQANAARVIVRNAVPETLPAVTADSGSLAQAVLNLLASGIDQTASGGAVVISALRADDGAIVVHVRDGSTHGVDMGERFVVFRDGKGKDGRGLMPVRSSMGLTLTRSLLGVNEMTLSVDPAGAEGMLFSLRIPPELVDNLSQRSKG